MESSSLVQSKKNIAGNTDTGFLKLLALIFMVLDHVGKVFFPTYLEFRMIGRLAFPLYCWCLVVGAVYSKDMMKYSLRILIVGIISQPFYMKALDHSFNELNIFFTLLLGLVGIWGIQHKKYGSQFWLPLASLLLSAILQVDYGWRGVMFMLLLFIAKENRNGIAALWIAFALYWGSSSSLVSSIFGFSIPYPENSGLYGLITSFFKLQGLVWMALPLVYFPTKTNLHMPKRLGYALYPAHLLIIWLLRIVIF